jgi:hypothetical protein
MAHLDSLDECELYRIYLSCASDSKCERDRSCDRLGPDLLPMIVALRRQDWIHAECLLPLARSEQHGGFRIKTGLYQLLQIKFILSGYERHPGLEWTRSVR